jgi:hypothetical protein
MGKTTTIDARLTLPTDLHKRLLLMSRKRDMPMNRMLSQLVQIGAITLSPEIRPLECGRQDGDIPCTLVIPHK